MSEWCLYTPGAPVPDHVTPAWYQTRERAPHLEQHGHQGRLHLAAELCAKAAAHYGCRTVSDLGAGDGGLLSLIHAWFDRAWGYDLQPANIDGADSRGVDVILADVTGPNIVTGDLAVCTEVLEHLLNPHGFLSDLPSGVLVASSPAFETDRSHYPFHTWAWDQVGYGHLVEQAGYRVKAHEITGDFQVLLAVRA